ncbi:MAG: ABC transporter permease subunit [Deltaproteobacteria bacterium]|nr:ABC transporter permease subunit [Deltaproteobacteria bacterium]
MSSVIDYLPLILKGMLLTIEVAVLSLLISVLLGMIGALAKMSGSRIARSIAGIYTTVIRGMPDLVLMTLIFFGGQILLNNVGEKLGLEYIDVSPFVAGVITIGFIFGAYMAETFRGGILAVSRGEIEAGYAFGMTPMKVFMRITLPAMVRHTLPGFGNFTFLCVVAFLYLLITGVSDIGIRWLDKRYSVGVRKA